MNVNLYNTTDYEYIFNWTLGENKPNSNPIAGAAGRIKFLLFFFLNLAEAYADKTSESCAATLFYDVFLN